jgi:TetR/AcrR family transcriptional regulator, transcriptional repressor for nem operon
MTTAEFQTASARQRILDAAKPIMASRGFSAVGLNEVLSAAGVPKGSFYHHFVSKDVFGQALLQAYFDKSLEELEDVLNRQGASVGNQLMNYWQRWVDNQMGSDPYRKCLVVKLGAEVSDLSEAMRQVLNRGTDAIIDRLAVAINEGVSDGSLSVGHDPAEVARTLYQTWLGASVMAKISGSRSSFENAASVARRMLQPRLRENTGDVPGKSAR